MKYKLLALALLLPTPVYGQTAIIKLVNMATYSAGTDGKFHSMVVPDGTTITITYNNKPYSCQVSVNQCDITVPLVIPAPSWLVTKMEMYNPGLGYTAGVEIPKIDNLLATKSDLKKFVSRLLGKSDGQ